MGRFVDRLRALTFQRAEGRPPATLAGFSRALVAIGGEPSSDFAVDWAGALLPIFDPRVTLVHVVEPPATLYGDVYGFTPLPQSDVESVNLATEQIGMKILDAACEKLRDLGCEPDLEQPLGAPVREICEAVERVGADLTVVGSPPHSGVERLLLGSVADGVKNHARSHVLLAKAPATPGDVIAAVDGSAASESAALLAHRIARAWGSRLTVVHVATAPGRGSRADEERFASGLRTRLGFPWKDVAGADFEILAGDPRERIARFAEERRPSLLAMGSRGLGGFRSLVAGSVTNYVSHEVDVPMLLVKDLGSA